MDCILAAALGVPTVAIHLGVRPAISRALGDNVTLAAPKDGSDDVGPARVIDAAGRTLAA